MPDYVNSNDYDLHLVGPDGKKITIRRGKSVQLPSFFDRYVRRGFLKQRHLPKQVGAVAETARPKVYRPSRSLALRSAKKRLQEAGEAKASERVKKNQKRTITTRVNAGSGVKATSHVIRRVSKSRARRGLQSTIVGRGFRQGATDSLHKTLSAMFYPISNGIGVGILSFNRPKSLRRLVNSIIRTTDLHRTTVFISDDGSTDTELHRYLAKLEKTNNFVILRNETRIGIAGNSNRLLRCLQRFPHKLLLNDDVEVLKKGWEHFYSGIMQNTKMHHFCLHQPGVYGAFEGVRQPVGNKILIRVDARPHGAVMALDDRAFAKVGFFDESFGYYGMEHVDWSTRVAAAKLQPSGYWDAEGADKFFKIYADRSAVPDRVKHLQVARAKYKPTQRPVKVAATARSEVPSISCVIPFRDIGRHRSIMTAIDNVRAQRFPCIEMIVAEQDDETRFQPAELRCLTPVLVRAPGKPFNKSKAFNAGVARAHYDKLLLHDADTLAPAHYTQLVANALDRADSCHFGARVIYADKASTSNINKHGRIDKTTTAEKIVTYFEGGSLGCLADTYWRVGGFVEGYWGYGCEDCDFYYRLSKGSRWHENRIIDLVHLWHARTSGWIKHHDANKEFEKKLAGLTVKERILKQHGYLKDTSYAKFVTQALAKRPV